MEQEQVNEKPGQTQAAEQSAGQSSSAPTQEAAEDQSVPTYTLRADRKEDFRTIVAMRDIVPAQDIASVLRASRAFDAWRKANPGKVR